MDNEFGGGFSSTPASNIFADLLLHVPEMRARESVTKENRAGFRPLREMTLLAELFPATDGGGKSSCK